MYKPDPGSTVSVSATPPAPVISVGGSTTFCQGDSVILSISSNPAYTYQWELNGRSYWNKFIFSCKTAGIISEVSYSTGCSSYSSNTVAVTVNAKPAVPTITPSGSTDFCSGLNVGLSVVNNSSLTYQWIIRN